MMMMMMCDDNGNDDDFDWRRMTMIDRHIHGDDRWMMMMVISMTMTDV